MNLARPGRRSTVLCTAVATAVLSGAVAAGGGASGAVAGAAAPAPATAGSSGIGDSYFPLDGNGGYDVRHYGIDDRYDVATGRLTGSTVLTAVAKKRLSRFNVDLVLAVDDVRIGGAPVASYRKNGRHELVVTPVKPLPRGSRFRLKVSYHGTPGRIGFEGNKPWFRSGSETMAMNQPQIAPWWFAANDHPRDKARFDIRLSVPEGNQAISNGELVSESTSGGWSTWHWRIRQRITTYLAFFAAGRFEVETGVARGLPFTNAVSMRLRPGDRGRAMRLMRRSPGVVRWLERQFGDYPYSSTGGVTTSLFTGFALENASRPTYPYLGNGRFGQDIVVHELAHQWFGDDVAVARWRDIWLNEGFATWVEWRYREGHGGRTAQKTLLRRYGLFGSGDPMWKLRIGDPGPRRLFAFAVYERGAMTLQALRHRIGNRDFSRLLRRWAAQRGDGNARTWQFTRLAEQVSGERLGGFFDAWLRDRSKPARTAANGLR